MLEADGSIGFAIGPHDTRATLVIDPSLFVTTRRFWGVLGPKWRIASASTHLGMSTLAGQPISRDVSESLCDDLWSGHWAGLRPEARTANISSRKLIPMFQGRIRSCISRFLGGSGSQSGGLIAVDPSGNVAITGTTTSADFPVTDGSISTSGANDVSVSEIDPTGSTLLFSTLFGGSGAESQYAAGGIAFDSQDKIYVASDTTSQDLPVTSGAFQPTFAGRISDGFLAVFQPGASPDLTYCSYLGQTRTRRLAWEESRWMRRLTFTSRDSPRMPRMPFP